MSENEYLHSALNIVFTLTQQHMRKTTELPQYMSDWLLMSLRTPARATSLKLRVWWLSKAPDVESALTGKSGMHLVWRCFGKGPFLIKSPPHLELRLQFRGISLLRILQTAALVEGLMRKEKSRVKKKRRWSLDGAVCVVHLCKPRVG